MRVLFAAALALVAVTGALANQAPPPPMMPYRAKFDLRDCLKYATAHNRSACTACNVATGMWCESETHAKMCTGTTAPAPCDACNNTALYVRNARTVVNIIRHDCEACKVALAETDILAARAVAHMNKEVAPSTMKECGALCGLTACIEASGKADFGNDDPSFDGEFALNCRHQVLELCMTGDRPPV